MSHNLYIQRGFSLIMAIFLVVVLGGIAVFMGKVVTMQYQSLNMDEESASAYQAARSGVEWGVYQILQNAPNYTCATSCTMTSCAAPTNGSSSSSVSLAGTLAPYTVTVACACRPYCEGARDFTNPLKVYTLTSTASKGTTGSLTYVERQVSAAVAK